MRHGGRADAALGADDRDDSPHRFGIRRREQAADGPHDVDRADRRHQIVAHAATRQLAIEPDIVDTARGRSRACPRHRLRPADRARRGCHRCGESVSIRMTFGVRRTAIGFERGGDAAHLDFDMRLRRGGGLLPAACTAAAVSTVSQKACTEHARRRRDVIVARRIGRRRASSARNL